ncbi:TPA: hypothetical protein N0F65_012362 [Lagenidium giganteum]|uniref:RNase H type-1 domain-containing protein n=1 Tax=Lagenidium giganteum TaxID=4803 RepID=A0AAV2YMB8_9STRA|nr:TPA: hypothetical protein N0F65_012362 [Lagenidium giganteum]
MQGLWRAGNALQHGNPHERHLRWIQASKADTRAAIYHSCAAGAVLTALLRLLRHSTPITVTTPYQATRAPTLWLLVFDGGSRGNPGLAGCGSILLRYDTLHGSHSIVHAAAHFMGTRQTNNQAEYHALLLGLRAARRHRAHHLHVIGDSMMILRQHRTNHAPRNRRLAGTFQQTKRLADQLMVTQWHHHYRAYNKMADHAANVAMDLQDHRTWPSTTHTALDGLPELASNDVLEWEGATSLSFGMQPPRRPQPHSRVE